MTPVGHTLAGLSLGVCCMPRTWRPWRKAVLLGSFAVLAYVPDIPWGPSRLVRHSLFVNLALMAVPAAMVALWPALRRRIGGWAVFGLGIAAWLSHLLLDTTYSHGKGDRLFWPISSTAAVKLTVPWFDVARPGLAAWQYVRIWSIEAFCYGLLLAGCVAVRQWLLRRRPARGGGRPGLSCPCGR